MLISPAYAQAAGAGGGDMFVSLMPLLLIFVVFYFLLIRPQQQKAKQHRDMIEALKKGDQVVTSGGIIGKVTRVEADNTLLVEIAQNVQVKVAKHTIADLFVKPVPAPANDAKAATTTTSSSGPAAFLQRFFKK